MRKKFRKLTSILLAVIMAFGIFTIVPITASAATNGDFKYRVLEDGTAEIIDYYGSTEILEIPSELAGRTVTSIRNTAFYGCKSLKSVTIPESVTEIGSYSFQNCASLTEINISNNNPNYSSVDGVVFNKDKTELIIYPPGGKAEVTISNSVTSIGVGAFCTCNNLVSVTIPASVTSIGNSAFSGCSSLTSVTIPDGVTEISRGAFSGCTSLKSITIPNSVIKISDDSFANCTSLTSITIPNSVTEIGWEAFQECTSLSSIKIPASVTSIGDSAFLRCTNLTEINIDNNNPNYCDIDGVVYNKGKTELIICPPRGKTEVSIPNSVTIIYDQAFYDCYNLTSIIIPDSVTSIGLSAFWGCISLTSVKIPDSVTTICWDAFGYYTYNRDKVKIDGFTIYGYAGSAAETYANDNGFSFVALDESSEHTLEDKNTGITVTSDTDAELVVEMLTNSDSIEKVNTALNSDEELTDLYDISLVKNGEAVTLGKEVTVKIPSKSENAKVYRVETDGSITDMKAVYDTGYMVFTTDHFSLYALVVPKTLLTGDVDRDGELTVKDATEIQKYIVEIAEFDDEQLKLADVDGDKDITVKDATYIQKIIVEII